MYSKDNLTFILPLVKSAMFHLNKLVDGYCDIYSFALNAPCTYDWFPSSVLDGLKINFYGSSTSIFLFNHSINLKFTDLADVDSFLEDHRAIFSKVLEQQKIQQDKDAYEKNLESLKQLINLYPVEAQNMMLLVETKALSLEKTEEGML